MFPHLPKAIIGGQSFTEADGRKMVQSQECEETKNDIKRTKRLKVV